MPRVTVPHARVRRWVPLPLGCALAVAVLSADSNLDLSKSSIIATFRQEAAPIDVPFRNFTGTIVYDAANPAATSAELAVDMNSLDVGDETSSAEVRKPAWFDSGKYPQATFRSTAVKPGAPGQFDATGTLSIKGQTQSITVAITVQRVGNFNAYDGNFELSRKFFGIGDASWDEVLDDKVRVRFHLLAAS